MSVKKNWFRLSLKTLLVVFTCVALAVGWFAHYANKRWAAFEAIQQAGEIHMGLAKPSKLEQWFGYQLFGTVNEIDLRKAKVDNDLLKHIGALKELRHLDLSNVVVDDAGLRQIMHLPLRKLWLQGTNITDESAETLSRMKSLRFLQLNATSLSDSFLEQLDALPELKNLGLRGTRVTSVGMKYLSRHPKLQEVYLYQTEVDDSGVANLVDCQSLVYIGLPKTNVTDVVFEHLDRLPNLANADLSGNRSVTTEAVLAFEKSHPNCDILWYGN